MKSQNITAIIIGHKPIGESDKIIFLYNDQLGKVRAIAKGARKINSKFTGHLETFNLCQIELYFGPRNIIIKEAISQKNLISNTQDLQKITSVLKVAEITNKALFENQCLESLQKLLTETLQYLEHSPKKLLILTTFIIKIMDLSGLIPDFQTLKIEKNSQKYMKLFHYLQNQPLSEINKIKLSEEEELHIKNLSNRMLTLISPRLQIGYL